MGNQTEISRSLQTQTFQGSLLPAWWNHSIAWSQNQSAQHPTASWTESTFSLQLMAIHFLVNITLTVLNNLVNLLFEGASSASLHAINATNEQPPVNTAITSRAESNDNISAFTVNQSGGGR